MSMKIASISVALVATTLLAIACTTTTTTTSSSSSSSSGSSGDAGKEAGKSSSSSSSGSTEEEEETPATCKDESSFQACGQCCATEHSKGYQDYTAALLGCLCKPANCETECATTFCASTPKNPDAACTTCLDSKESACQQEFSDACSASKDCVDFNNCLADNCKGKK